MKSITIRNLSIQIDEGHLAGEFSYHIDDEEQAYRFTRDEADLRPR